MHRRTLLGTAAAAALAAALPAAALAETAKPEVWEIALGPADAKVTLTEYASYTCPHCANFHAGVFKDLKRDYIDTGKIRFVYREVYFDRYGLWAAMVARCGGEMRYFGIQDMLYTQQREWSGAGDPAAIVGALRKIGLTAGLTTEQLDACLSDGAMAEALVARFQETAEADKVDSTPTLLVNGTKYGNMSYADLKAILDKALAE